jgi:hypothetical protein
MSIYIYNLFNVYASHLHGQYVEAGCELICSVRPGQWDTPYMFTIAHVRSGTGTDSCSFCADPVFHIIKVSFRFWIP